MIRNARLSCAGFGALWVLLSTSPHSAQAQILGNLDFFLQTESRYYASTDTLKLIYAQSQQQGGNWYPVEDSSSKEVLYLVGKDQYVPGTAYTTAYSFRTLRIANERYCQLRALLTQLNPKATPPANAELPICFTVVLYDSLSRTAKSQDVSDLQLAVSKLKTRVDRLEKKQ